MCVCVFFSSIDRPSRLTNESMSVWQRDEKQEQFPMTGGGAGVGTCGQRHIGGGMKIAPLGCVQETSRSLRSGETVARPRRFRCRHGTKKRLRTHVQAPRAVTVRLAPHLPFREAKPQAVHRSLSPSVTLETVLCSRDGTKKSWRETNINTHPLLVAKVCCIMPDYRSPAVSCKSASLK